MTKDVSLDDDVHEKLDSLRREDESVSDVIRRLASETSLADYYGVLSEETAEELDDHVSH